MTNLTTKLINGINLCSDEAIAELKKELSENAFVMENQGTFITEGEIKEIMTFKDDIILIADFNCKKIEAERIFNYCLTSSKKIVLSIDRHDLIDLLFSQMERANFSDFVAITKDKVLSLALCHRLRFF